MGRPLLDLPTPHEIVMKIDFNPPEKILYRAVEGHLREEINNNLEDTDKTGFLGQVQEEHETSDPQTLLAKNLPESQSD
jgi:hypothetical protein